MTQLTLQMQITIEALTEAIAMLELSEKIRLRELLDLQIAQAKPSDRETKKEIVLEPAIDCFCQGWQDVMSGNIHPISTLWEGIEFDTTAIPFWQIVVEHSSKVPEEIWDSIPSDASQNLNTYL